ncbi:Os10g0378500, partial [Oryza sativa Japonica Group]
VIFRATYWLRQWVQLQKYEEDGVFLNVACRNLETMVMQLFANYGWRFTNRLEYCFPCHVRSS